MDYDSLTITTAQAQRLVFQFFNIRGEAFPLPGEIDFNFRIKVPDGDGYILKVSRVEEDNGYLEYQQKLLQYVAAQEIDLISPLVIKDVHGNEISEYNDSSGNLRKVRLLTWIPGRLWSGVNPQLDTLRLGLGERCGRLTHALQGFDHPMAHRQFEWDIAQALWTKTHLNLFETAEKEILSHFMDAFENNQGSYAKLRKSVVHNDANDNNIIVWMERIP